MSDGVGGVLRGMRVLIVEDEHLVALALADDLEEAGAVVLGPASTVEAAFGLIDEHKVEAAVLDIKLQTQLVFPVADLLLEKGVPFIFTTGFDADSIPDKYADVPKCGKPARLNAVTEMLIRWTGRNGQNGHGS